MYVTSAKRLLMPQTAPAKDQIISFVVSFIWDIVPASLVCLLFWHIPKPREGERRGDRGGGPEGGFVAMSNPTLVRNFFSCNPPTQLTRV